MDRHAAGDQCKVNKQKIIAGLKGYLLGALLVLAGLGMRWLIGVATGTYIAPYAAFFPLVVATAFFIGSGPAIFVIMLTAAITMWLHPLDYYSSISVAMLGTSLFIITALMIVWLCERQRNAMRHARSAQDIATEARRRVGHFIESLTDGFVAIDRDFTITYINSAARDRIFGGQVDDLLGKGLWSRSSLLSESPVQQVIGQSMASQSPQRSEQFRVEDGSWFDLRIYPQNGNGLAIFIRDITEEKKSQDRLAENEDWLRLAMFAADLGTFDYYPADDRLIWSSRVYEMFGLPVGQPMSAKLAIQCVHPEDREPVRQKLARVMRDGSDGTYVSTYRVVHRDGTIRWIRSQGRSLFTGQGSGRRAIRMVGTTMDVTERIEAEQQRTRLLIKQSEAREAAELSSKLKDQFLSSLSHELRTPLNAMLGWIQLLQMDAAMSPQERIEGMQIIERNARAQLRMIEDLLDMNRLDTGRIHLRPKQMNLAQTVRMSVEAVRPRATDAGLMLSAENLPEIQLLADEARIGQMMVNLLDNAVKFTPRGGRVTVRLEQVGQEVRLQVIDTGQGIPRQFLEHVFERFRQADSSITRRHGGLGLGLGIAKQIVTLHGGTITADSDGEQMGTTITVTLPMNMKADKVESSNLDRSVDGDYALPSATIEEEVKQAKSAAEVYSPSPPAIRQGLASTSTGSVDGKELSGLSILVIDDEPDARQLLEKYLGYHGASVMTAGSADEGVKLAEQHKPSLIISDIGMSGRDGYQMIRELRQREKARGYSTPAIALTAFAQKEDRQRALEAGYQEHLPKPVESDRLVEVIGELVQK